MNKLKSTVFANLYYYAKHAGENIQKLAYMRQLQLLFIINHVVRHLWVSGFSTSTIRNITKPIIKVITQ